MRIFRKLWFAFFLFFGSILVGITGFMFIEHYGPAEAFYMAVITFSTVGFQEVKPLTDQGRIFTGVYIILNLGIFAYVISVFSTFIFEGELRKALQNFMIGRDVKKMKDHIIICGFGRNGAKAAEVLQMENKKFVIIEKDTHAINAHPSNRAFQFVQGDSTQDEVLLEAGIDRAETLIITLPKDSDNVFIALTGRQLNPNIRIIARASEAESEKKLYRAGANRVVMPDSLGGIHMAQLITKPYVIEFLEMLNGVGDQQMILEEINFNQLKNEYQNMSLKDLNIRFKSGVSIIAIKSGNKTFLFNPSGDHIISDGDVLILLATPENLNIFMGLYCN